MQVHLWRSIDREHLNDLTAQSWLCSERTLHCQQSTIHFLAHHALRVCEVHQIVSPEQLNICTSALCQKQCLLASPLLTCCWLSEQRVVSKQPWSARLGFGRLAQANLGQETRSMKEHVTENQLMSGHMTHSRGNSTPDSRVCAL